MVRVGVWLTWNTACSDRSLRGKLSRTGVCAFHPRIFQSRICYDITCSMFKFEVVTKSSPPPRSLPPHPFISSGQRLPPPPHFNGKDALALDTSPSPLFPSLSPSPPHPLVLVSRLHYDLARFLAPRASLDLPPSPSRIASPLVLFARRVLFFLAPPTLECLYHPLASSICPRPRPCLRSCAGKLGMYNTSYF